MEKDKWYGQCRLEGLPVPEGWTGTIYDYGMGAQGAADVPSSAPITAAGPETVPDIMPGPESVPDVMPGPTDDKYMAVIAKDYIPNVDVPNLVMIEVRSYGVLCSAMILVLPTHGPQICRPGGR